MKVTIEDIEIPGELEGLKFQDISTFQNISLRHKYGPFTCCVCGQVAVKRVLYDYSDKEQSGIRVEKYCSRCFPQIEREQKTTLLTATNGKDKTIAVRDNNLSGVEHK